MGPHLSVGRPLPPTHYHDHHATAAKAHHKGQTSQPKVTHSKPPARRRLKRPARLHCTHSKQTSTPLPRTHRPLAPPTPGKFPAPVPLPTLPFPDTSAFPVLSHSKLPDALAIQFFTQVNWYPLTSFYVNPLYVLYQQILTMTNPSAGVTRDGGTEQRKAPQQMMILM